MKSAVSGVCWLGGRVWGGGDARDLVSLVKSDFMFKDIICVLFVE